MQWSDEFSFVLNFRLLSSMVVALSIFLAGCSNPKLRAPVEERKVGAMRSVIVAESSYCGLSPDFIQGAPLIFFLGF